METIRTLIVDDEKGMRLGVERALRKFRITMPDVEDEIGFEIELAETGEEALRKIEEFKPEIMLLDYKLPGISGLDILDQIAPKKLNLLTIMITAYASIETAVLAVKRGAYDFLSKPFTPEELKKTIAKAARKIVLEKQVRKLAAEKRKVRFQFV